MGEVYIVRVMCCLDIAIAYSATTVLPADVCASSRGGGEDGSVREIETVSVCCAAWQIVE